jgi:hypothetical protein
VLIFKLCHMGQLCPQGQFVALGVERPAGHFIYFLLTACNFELVFGALRCHHEAAILSEGCFAVGFGHAIERVSLKGLPDLHFFCVFAKSVAA